MWQIEFYVKENGRIPVEEFLDTLSPKKDLPYILNAIERLSQYGYELHRPYTDYLIDDIYELRIRTINGQFRILYFFFDGKKIILTHGFKKKTSKVPDGEIKLARVYKSSYFNRAE